MQRIEVTIDAAERIAGWLRDRGGVAVWPSLLTPENTMTPALKLDGTPTERPSWRHATTPAYVVTDPACVDVVVPEKVTAFRVAVEPGDGLQLVLTAAAKNRLQRELAAAGDTAWYEFDYGAYHNCVIFRASETTTLLQIINKS